MDYTLFYSYNKYVAFNWFDVFGKCDVRWIMAINIDSIYSTTLEHYKNALKNVTIEKRAMLEHSAAISDAIPGFSADKLEFGSYDKENFAVLF